jgi:hypothetical protein
MLSFNFNTEITPATKPMKHLCNLYDHKPPVAMCVHILFFIFKEKEALYHHIYAFVASSLYACIYS